MLAMGSPLRAGVRGLGFAGAAAGGRGAVCRRCRLPWFWSVREQRPSSQMEPSVDGGSDFPLLVPRALACCPSTPARLGGAFGRVDDFPLSIGGKFHHQLDAAGARLELAERRCLTASAAVRVVA